MGLAVDFGLAVDVGLADVLGLVVDAGLAVPGFFVETNLPVFGSRAGVRRVDFLEVDLDVDLPLEVAAGFLAEAGLFVAAGLPLPAWDGLAAGFLVVELAVPLEGDVVPFGWVWAAAKDISAKPAARVAQKCLFMSFFLEMRPLACRQFPQCSKRHNIMQYYRSSKLLQIYIKKIAMAEIPACRAGRKPLGTLGRLTSMAP